MEPEHNLELNRLVSGEMSPEESLTLMRRMLRDPKLRQDYEELQMVDDLLREACLSEELAAEGDDEDDHLAAGECGDAHRQKQLDGVVAAIEAAAVRSKASARDSRRRRRRVRLPWAAAAAVLVIFSMALTGFSAWQVVQNARIHQLDEGRVAGLAADAAALRKQLGEKNAVIVWNGDDAEFEVVKGEINHSVALLVTVVRTTSEARDAWSAEAIIPLKHSVEMVTQERDEWPDNVRVNVKSSHAGHVVIVMNGRIMKDRPSDITIESDLVVGEPKSVASLDIDGARYEVFVVAQTMPSAGLM